MNDFLTFCFFVWNYDLAALDVQRIPLKEIQVVSDRSQADIRLVCGLREDRLQQEHSGGLLRYKKAWPDLLLSDVLRFRLRRHGGKRRKVRPSDQFLYLFRSTVLEWNAEARVQNGDRRRRYHPKLQIVYWRKNRLSILMNVSV